MIRLVIVDDHLVFREGVALTLGVEADIRVVGEGTSAAEAVQLVDELKPDVLLLDLDIPGGGLSVLQTISKLAPAPRVVVLTASTNEAHLVAALKVGAKGYVHKGISARELAAIVRSIHAGRGYVPPFLAAHVLSMGIQQVPSPDRGVLGGLTERESQILRLVADGLSNRQIAASLHLAEKTIKNHMTEIMHKLEVHNRVEAALMIKQATLK